MSLESLFSLRGGNLQYTDIIDGSLAAQLLFTICYLISSFVISSNAYAGFIAVFTGLVFLTSIITTYYGIRKNINRTMYGAVLGASSVLLLISLQTAIFWGQYGTCEKSWATSWRYLNETYFETRITKHGSYGDECYNTAAMKSVCAFSVFMFLSYIVLIGAMLLYKEQLLGTDPLNEGYSPVQSLPGPPDYTPHPPGDKFSPSAGNNSNMTSAPSSSSSSSSSSQQPSKQHTSVDL